MLTPERWQLVKELFHGALEREGGERVSFIEAACAGDEELRREVETLVGAHELPGSFIDSPAYEVGAELLLDGQAGPLAGKSLGHYRVLALLGAGGMGEVYLAEDTRLGRRVALKLLPGGLGADEDRLRRFEREARAASALNHPNILTIHEIGRADSLHYIATEFVEGVTLREHMSGTRMAVGEVLDVAVQVASALQAAHGAGIVHRDVKPENIMLRQDGYVKVLDFGIAKLTTRQGLNYEDSEPTGTSPRVIIGTSSYMSPEQAQGLHVDVRTDVWSLGVVLYEMLAGHAPFQGATLSDVLAGVIEAEPLPLERCALPIPVELRRIVQRALHKDREGRYRSVTDILIDLKALKRDLEFGSGREDSAQPGSGHEAAAYGREHEARGGAGELATLAGEVVHARLNKRPWAGTRERSLSTAEYILSGLGRHKIIAASGFVTFVIATSITFIIYHFNPPNKPAALGAIKLKRLTNTGGVIEATVSPDGKYVIYVVSEVGSQRSQQSLRLRQVATNSDTQLIPPAEVQYYGLTFSPDGCCVYFVRNENDLKGALYQVPVIGGSPRKLLAGVYSPVTFSPDGKQFAFSRSIKLMVANADGTGERVLATSSSFEPFLAPAWSPDGKVIVCAVMVSIQGDNYKNLVEVRVADGAEKLIFEKKWYLQGSNRIAWLPDSTGLIVTAHGQGSSSSQIWVISYPSGDSRRITNDLGYYHSVSLTADATALVAVQVDHHSDIWTVPTDGETPPSAHSGTRVGNGMRPATQDGLSVDMARAKRLTTGIDESCSWTPDDKIVFASNAKGSWDIWVMDADGRNQKQLTDDDHFDHSPTVSADGRHVIFVSARSGRNNIWRMDVDGGNLKQLTSGGGEYYPQCTPDGQWVVYNKLIYQEGRLQKVSIDGGTPVDIRALHVMFWPAISPDGKLLAYYYPYTWSEQGKYLPSIEVTPFPDSTYPTKNFYLSANEFSSYPNRFIRWTPDGRALTYVEERDGASNIWLQPLVGGPAKQLTDFKSDLIFDFAWSRDGKQLALTRGTETRDVVVISDFK